jgi:hypothetical protein
VKRLQGAIHIPAPLRQFTVDLVRR